MINFSLVTQITNANLPFWFTLTFSHFTISFEPNFVYLRLIKGTLHFKTTLIKAGYNERGYWTTHYCIKYSKIHLF